MPAQYRYTTGGTLSNLGVAANDPTLQPFIRFRASLPDTFSGQNITFSGKLVGVSGTPLAPLAAVSLGGSSPIALPAVPSAGNATIYILEADSTSGAVTLKSNTAAIASVTAPAVDNDAKGNPQVLLFTHQINNGDTIPSMRVPTLPDLA